MAAEWLFPGLNAPQLGPRLPPGESVSIYHFYLESLPHAGHIPVIKNQGLLSFPFLNVFIRN